MFTEHSDPVKDLGIGRIEAYDTNDKNEVRIFTVKQWELLKRHERLQKRYMKRMYMYVKMEDEIVDKDGWSTDKIANKLEGRLFDLQNGLISLGLSKHTWRCTWVKK